MKHICPTSRTSVYHYNPSIVNQCVLTLKCGFNHLLYVPCILQIICIKDSCLFENVANWFTLANILIATSDSYLRVSIIKTSFMVVLLKAKTEYE